MCVLLLSVQAQIAFDYSLADALRSQSLHTLKKLGDEFMEINVLLEDSWTSLDKGDYTHTERQLKQYVSISREAKDLNNLWTTLWWLAFTAVRRGECGAAIEWLQQSRVAAHESGISNFMARTIELWAVCEPQQALTLGEEELARYRHAGDDVGIADMQLALGRIQMDLGQLDAAQVLLMDCLKLWRRLGMAGNEWGGAGWACLELGHLAAMQGDSPLAVAEQWFKHGLAHFRDVGMKWGIALVLAGLHDMALHLGQTDRAARCAGAASGMLRPEELITLRPADRLPFERAIASAQVRCARDTAFAVARHAGQGIPLIQVCQWVLEVENT